jgi:hypothetical protein
LVYAGGARVTALAFERSHELAEDSVHETMGPSLQRNVLMAVEIRTFLAARAISPG